MAAMAARMKTAAAPMAAIMAIVRAVLWRCRATTSA
jgi:hypothetical protein